MQGLDQLRRIAPPPGDSTGRSVDVERVRTELGVGLPNDYLALVREWGAGEFDDFIGVYEPGHPNVNVELVEKARGWSWALHELRDGGGALPFDPDVGPGGLLTWGSTGNGDPCFWHLRSEDPASWTIVVQEGRGPNRHLYEGGLVDFLVAVLRGRERVSVFPEDYPRSPPASRPFKADCATLTVGAGRRPQRTSRAPRAR